MTDVQMAELKQSQRWNKVRHTVRMSSRLLSSTENWKLLSQGYRLRFDVSCFYYKKKKKREIGWKRGKRQEMGTEGNGEKMKWTIAAAGPPASCPQLPMEMAVAANTALSGSGAAMHTFSCSCCLSFSQGGCSICIICLLCSWPWPTLSLLPAAPLQQQLLGLSQRAPPSESSSPANPLWLQGLQLSSPTASQNRDAHFLSKNSSARCYKLYASSPSSPF